MVLLSLCWAIYIGTVACMQVLRSGVPMSISSMLQDNAFVLGRGPKITRVNDSRKKFHAPRLIDRCPMAFTKILSASHTGGMQQVNYSNTEYICKNYGSSLAGCFHEIESFDLGRSSLRIRSICLRNRITSLCGRAAAAGFARRYILNPCFTCSKTLASYSRLFR
jgi:hypothetical protein